MRALATITFVAAMAVGPAAFACKVDKAGYDALRTGMSYADAVRVLGCAGEEISSSELGGFVTVMVMWEGQSFASNMNAMFQNDELVSKAQFGLK